MLVRRNVKLLPDIGPRPRLLETAVSALPSPDLADVINRAPADRSRRRFVRLLVRTFVAAAFVALIAHLAIRRISVHEESDGVRKVIPVGTETLHRGTEPTAAPSPIMVQVSSDVVQVTSIALGHPRLAVINGKQVAEGDTIVVHTPIRAIAVTLRVIEITDGQVKLNDGAQVITVRLTKRRTKSG